jgi:crossover junction endodeoxyribonuclease RusA
MPTLDLPWPPSGLSPNVQMHWAARKEIKKKYKNDCFWLAKNRMPPINDGNIPIKLIFHPPTKRKFDLDNSIARMKSGLDGVAMAWGVNDFQFRPITATVGEIIKRGKVTIEY